MKSRAVPTKREAETLADMVYKDTIQALQDETAVGIIATARFFGLGEKRLKRYLDFLAEVKHEYNLHSKDGVLREMLEKDLTELHIAPDTIFESIDPIGKTMREIKVEKKKSAVSMAEAAELDKKLRAFREFMDKEVKA